MILKTDCSHFPGDRPCIYNKREGIVCNACTYYNPITFKILIIKLDAVGDVLRTTSLLHALKKKYPYSHITWITKHNAKDIFRNNNYVDNLLFLESPELNARLMTEEFNLLINTDASPTTSALAAIAKASEKKGFILNELGKVVPVDENAIEWFEMGAFDYLKKANTKTYQQLIHELCGLTFEGGEIMVNLNKEEQKFRDAFIQKYNLQKYDYIIGLNTGASKRWRLKQWHFEGFIDLIIKLQDISNTAILLYGGKEEEEKNALLKSRFPNVIDTGSDNSLGEFFALMDIPDIVLTSDTLALHTAAALKKKIICLFGPTSSNEIEDYSRIIKISPKMDCLVCYKLDCDFVPNCMDLITSDMILNEIKSLIKELDQQKVKI